MVRASPTRRDVSIRRVEVLPPTVGVIGYGVDGRSVTAWLGKQAGVQRILVYDDREVDLNGRVERGRTLEGVGVLFRSPGVKVDHPLLLEAATRGIPVTSSTRWFLRHAPARTIGITGSNGKTTCSTLIAEMLRAEYGDEVVEEGGNDRTPRLDLLSTSYKLQATSYAVLELSSFQLVDSSESPNVAVVLNLTPNHLDWHASMDEYAEAKRQIVVHQGERDIAVLNQHDPIVRSFAKGVKSEVRWLSDASTFNVQGSTFHFKTHPDTLRAAVTAARALHVSEENIAKVLREFRGVPHRLEFIRQLQGVRFYNDSSCTTPESAIVACEAFPIGSVVLLLGGRDKGMDYTKLYEVIEEREVRVVPYGEMAVEFERGIPTSYKLQATSSFEDIITAARRIAREGDNVVLSPACTSFDMFANAKERGAVFTELVKKL